MHDEGAGGHDADGASGADARFKVPREFLSKARFAAHHRDDGRWALLYRLLWRLTHGEPRVLENELAPDVARLRTLYRQAKRDAHKMKAFVRFRKVEAAGTETFIAWYRSDHPVLPLVAPFFADRFNDQRWAVLTPWGSAFWTLERLRFGPSVPRSEAPAADALEDLWRTYYENIFNPARLKVRAMTAEMPKRYWSTLPEAELIPGLVRGASRRTQQMIGEERYPPAASFLPEEPDLAGLAAAVGTCRACPLHTEATRAVFGEGPAGARLMLVGEQPGDREDEEGRPFVGPAGQLLDRYLSETGLDRGEVYLTNTVKHFKFRRRGKRRIHQSPAQIEVSACLPWVEAEIEVVKPEMIVCLGATAARALIGGHVRITRDRGRVFRDARCAPWVMPTYHPSALLRIPDADVRERAAHAFRADLEQVARRYRASF